MRDFWDRVDSSLSPVFSYTCGCPGSPAEHEGNCGTQGPGWEAARADMPCMAMRSDRTRCRKRPIPDAPLCELHMEKAAIWAVSNNPKAFTRYLDQSEREYATAVIQAAQAADLQLELTALESRVYFIGIDDKIVKIGRSARPKARMAQIRQGSSLMPAGYDRRAVELLGSIPGGSRLEAQLHALLRPHRLDGEWFAMRPEVIAVVSFLLTGDMEQDACRVFLGHLTRPWWIDEGYLSLEEAEAAA